MIYDEDGVRLYHGDAVEVLASLPAESVDCVVTSPPYWALRAYSGEQQRIWGGDPDCAHRFTVERTARPNQSGGASPKQDTNVGSHSVEYGDRASYAGLCRCGAWQGGYGAEPTPELYVAHTVEVLRAIRRVLKPSGVVWWNVGDTYNAYNGGAGPSSALSQTQSAQRPRLATGYGLNCKTLKPKDLVLIPFRVALAAQADGWWVRSDVIWAKPNPMPESVTDRPTKAHEYVFLLTKSERYFWDQDAVREPFVDPLRERADVIGGNQGAMLHHSPGGVFVQNGGRPNAKRSRDRSNFRNGVTDPKLKHHGFEDVYPNEGGRNMRSVWTIPTQPSPLPHFAAFPDELAERCIKAACPADGVVLDPFAGTGTTLKVARQLGRQAIGIEISREYCELAVQRLRYGTRGTLAVRQGQGTLWEGA